MRSYALLFSCLLFCQLASAQVQVGERTGMEDPMAQFDKLKPADLEAFKKTSLVFIVPDQDAANIPAFESEIGKVWTINKFLVITATDAPKYLDQPGYSFASYTGIKHVLRSAVGRGGTTDTKNAPLGQGVCEYVYEIWMPHAKTPANFRARQVLARALMVPSVETLYKTDRFEAAFDHIKFEKGVPYKLYREGVFRNWGPAFLKGYLKTMNDYLAASKTLNYEESPVSDEQAIKGLKQDTLFVPDYVHHIRQSNEDIAKGSSEDKEEEKDSGEDYGFTVQYVSSGQLNTMIATRTKPFYYLSYYLGSFGKYVSVYESVSGRTVYQDHSKPLSFKFKKTELKKIAKELK